ncbi:hypothetical protein PoB_000144100, partial [Plakobranchus ocellatus]
MELSNYYLGFIIIFTALPSLHSIEDVECSRRSNQCLQRFITANRDMRTLC